MRKKSHNTESGAGAGKVVCSTAAPEGVSGAGLSPAVTLLALPA